jgi:hypothetical protein
MVLKKELKKILSNYLKVKSVTIREVEMARQTLEKKLFIENIVLLKEIEDRRDFMEEEIGMDMSAYEEKFLQIIENLFRMYFSKEQMALIQYYLYQVPLIENWDGKIDISDGKEMMTVEFETPEQVWNVISSIKKVNK